MIETLQRLWGWVFVLPGRLLVGTVRLYQLLLSPLIGRNCRFDPTCSEYAIQSVRKFGACKGLWRTLRRVMKCHPFHPGGYDPP